MTKFGRMCSDHLEHGRDAVHERDIDGLDHGPEREAPVGDHQGIGVPNAAQERIDLRIEDSGLQHRITFPRNWRIGTLCFSI